MPNSNISEGFKFQGVMAEDLPFLKCLQYLRYVLRLHLYRTVSDMEFCSCEENGNELEKHVLPLFVTTYSNTE